MIYSRTMPSQKRSDQSNERVNVFAVGNRIRANLHTGRIMEATIKAVIDRTDGQGYRWISGRTRQP